MHKRIKNNTHTYIIAWHSIMAKSCFSFFLFQTIFLNIFLIINPYPLCFGKMTSVKMRWVLGNRLQHNAEHDITLICAIHSREGSFSQFTVQSPFQPRLRLDWEWRRFPLWSWSMLPHSADSWIVEGIMSCFSNVHLSWMDQAQQFSNRFFVKSEIKERPPCPHNPVLL